MTEAILSFFQQLPPALTTVILAAIPIVEVRGAVPVALEVFHLPVVTAALLSFLGSVVPALVIPSILQAIEAPCRRASKPARASWTGRRTMWRSATHNATEHSAPSVLSRSLQSHCR